jgi:hypothetical protein
MSKANIWQWDENPANNTEVDGISLAENTMVPSDVNNAFREVMSQIITTEGKGTDVVSAATLTLTGPERYFHITGSTGPITDIDFTDAVDGRWAWLIFDSTPTLTHNATTLKLPGGADIVAAAGDRALFVQDSSDNVICLAYVPAAPVINTLNGQYKFPATQNASTNGNTLDDYEEAAWTPAVDAGTGTITTVGATSGVYVKIGQLVTLSMSLPITTNGTGASFLRVTNLPFTNLTGAVWNGIGRNSNTGATVVSTIASGASNITMVTTASAYPVGSGETVTMTISYRASA